MTKENSLRIDFLKFICAILVVTIHCKCPGGYIQELLVDGVATIAVPFFFLCSGYFLAKHLDTWPSWWSALRKRIRTLIVPYFIWSWLFAILIIAVAFSIDFCLGQHLGTTPFTDGQGVGLSRILKLAGLWKTPPLYQLWYIRCLFAFVALSPLIVFMLKKFGRAWLTLCFLSTILIAILPNETVKRVLRLVFSIGGLFYFSLGIYLFKKNITLPCMGRVSFLIGGGGNNCPCFPACKGLLRLKWELPFEWVTW